MSTLSIGIQDLRTSAAQKLDFSDSNVDDDSSRDSGIYMEEYSPSSVKPAGFRGLFSQEIEDQDSLVEHKLNDDSPLDHQAERSRDRTCGIKRKLHDNDTVRAKKSTMDYSMLQNTIKSAVERTETERDLVGDCSRIHRLPTVTGQQQDLHYVTPATVANLVTGRISLGSNADYIIIDCRYPYEYEGGHIPVALNLHTQEMLTRLTNDHHERSVNRDTVLIFHCEFSSQRGPKRARFLRNLDRQLNAEKYPVLNFPELYIMKGGYKDFYDQYREVCVPRCHIPMLHEDHKSDLEKFRSKFKSRSAERRLFDSRSGSNLKKLTFL